MKVYKFTEIYVPNYAVWEFDFGSTDQCSTSTFCIIDVPFTATEHLFIFMDFTNFSIYAASKCIYNIAASYLRQYNLCKSQAESRRGVHCSTAPIKVASNTIFLVPPQQPIPILILYALLLYLNETKCKLLQKPQYIPE